MDNINQKLKDILSSGKLKNSDISTFMNSAECQKLKNSLTAADKQKIMQMFSNMSENDIKQKLAKAKLGSLSHMSADEIIAGLKKL